EKTCNGKIVAVLEGGYSLPSIGKPVAAMVATMLGQDLGRQFYLDELKEINYNANNKQISIEASIQWHKRFWNL
ncbi:MAG: hypothetical protein SCK28_13445, partial [Bacillota bacterium]|nr:hypothetical protein [Bacillota bacterium]